MDICALPCKKPNSESKQTSIDDLSNDLLIEILHRIPLKPAHRFKCVSKRWVQVICQPQFAQRFTQRMKLLYPSQPSPPFTLFFQCSYPRPFPVEFKHFQRDPQFMSSNFSLSFLPQNPNPIIFIATSNGLVLCSTKLLSQMVYYVCNPLTANWVSLPVPPRCHSPVLAGFVCHSYHDDIGTITRFKVVRVSAIETEVCIDHGPCFCVCMYIYIYIYLCICKCFFLVSLFDVWDSKLKSLRLWIEKIVFFFFFFFRWQTNKFLLRRILNS